MDCFKPTRPSVKMVTERAATPDKDLELKIRHAEVNSEVK